MESPLTRSPKPLFFVVVEGAIGVGKTALARLLRDSLGCGLILETFEENPYLSAFYEDPEKYAFDIQMFFLQSRSEQMKQELPQLLRQGSVIADYMFAKDRLFARLSLSEEQWQIYEERYAELAKQIREPDLIIFLEAETEVLLQRIAQRGRPYESKMDRQYIDAVRRAYEAFFSKPLDVPVLRIDTNELNIVDRPDHIELVLDRVAEALREEGLWQSAHDPQDGPQPPKLAHLLMPRDQQAESDLEFCGKN